MAVPQMLHCGREVYAEVNRESLYFPQVRFHQKTF